MATFKDKEGNLHVIDEKFAYLLPKGCVEVPTADPINPPVKLADKPAKKVKK